MKTRVQTALVATLLSIIAHAYLTLHYYPLKFGFASGQSICNVSAKFDCDAVSTSAYSAFLGLPLSVWGGAFNAVLFFLILMGWLEWTEKSERTRRFALALSGASLIASLVMGAVSLLWMNSYCLFCIGLYVLSLITFFVYKGVLREPFWANFKQDVPAIFSESRWLLVSLAAIPVLAYLVHRMFMQNFSDEQLARMVNETISHWEASPKQEFVAKPSLTMGPDADKADMVLVEFADFRCGHCKHASYTLHPFVNEHKNVRFEFYSFPLDGTCNEKIESKDGISCRLAASVICAEHDGKGWDLQKRLFNLQDQTVRHSSVQDTDIFLSKQVAELGLNWESVERCMNDSATVDAIKAQAKQGALVNVMGTPTIFANGRQLNRGSMTPVLQRALEISKSKK